jgi:hypothetical protein
MASATTFAARIETREHRPKCGLPSRNIRHAPTVEIIGLHSNLHQTAKVPR